MNTSTWKKNLTIGVILLFIGVAVAPSINFNVVKASADNDFVEVSSQACGAQGFGNTTVKLTKGQYQNLEQYLVDFRARLNQTTTKEEAIPIFKDAVVELNKYGLLPRGMSVEQAQKLVNGPKLSSNQVKLLKGLFNNNASNLFCFLAVKTGLGNNGLNVNLVSLGGLLVGTVGALLLLISLVFSNPYVQAFFSFFAANVLMLGLIMILYGQVKTFIPWNILIGKADANYFSLGLLGIKKGFFPDLILFGFSGIEIINPTGKTYLGWAVATFSF